LIAQGDSGRQSSASWSLPDAAFTATANAGPLAKQVKPGGHGFAAPTKAKSTTAREKVRSKKTILPDQNRQPLGGRRCLRKMRGHLCVHARRVISALYQMSHIPVAKPAQGSVSGVKKQTIDASAGIKVAMPAFRPNRNAAAKAGLGGGSAEKATANLNSNVPTASVASIPSAPPMALPSAMPSAPPLASAGGAPTTSHVRAPAAGDNPTIATRHVANLTHVRAPSMADNPVVARPQVRQTSANYSAPSLPVASAPPAVSTTRLVITHVCTAGINHCHKYGG
jgi:hypothetical protein